MLTDMQPNEENLSLREQFLKELERNLKNSSFKQEQLKEKLKREPFF